MIHALNVETLSGKPCKTDETCFARLRIYKFLTDGMIPLEGRERGQSTITYMWYLHCLVSSVHNHFRGLSPSVE